MFGTNTITSSFSLSKVLGGISKGLTIANQVIPLYQQAKPMISNAKKIMNLVKEFNRSSTNSTPNNNKTTLNVEKVQEKTEVLKPQSNSLPVFFQ